jgi:DNA transposition AAA+ family ATPase
MILHSDPEKVTNQEGQLVIDEVRAFIFRTGRSAASIAKSLGISSGTLSQVMSWSYKGNWKQVLIDLDRWLEDENKRAKAPKPTEFVLTRIAEEIYTVAELAIQGSTIGLILGPSGVGKTLALKAIAAEKPGSVFVSIQTANATQLGLLKQIVQAMRLDIRLTAPRGELFDRIVKAFIGTSRLLIVDEIHKFCEASNHQALAILRDLYDATKAPQLWSSTVPLIQYLRKHEATRAGNEPLSQIRRRIGVRRDLMQRTREGGGNNGEPLFTLDEIRKVFGKNKMRLASDAARYLMKLANLPESGSLGACCQLVILATTANHTRADILTADMLRSMHSMLEQDSEYQLLSAQMEEEEQRPLAKAG